jgi:guanylate kinase
VIGAEHLDELRRRLAEQTHQGSASDRVTTVRLTRMRRRLSELEHISENTVGEAATSAEEELHEILNSLDNVRDIRPDDG